MCVSTGLAEGEKRLSLLCKCVKDLPKVNYATLKTLLLHLLKCVCVCVCVCVWCRCVVCVCS